MREFFSRVHEAALAAGGLGIFGVSFLDSSFVPLPEISDLMVVLMVMKHMARMPYYAAMATAGCEQTASSRSRTTASAPQANAFAKRSGRFPGTKR